MASYLRRPYVLEGWRDRPRCLRNPDTGEIHPLSRREFETLRRLDEPACPSAAGDASAVGGGGGEGGKGESGAAGQGTRKGAVGAAAFDAAAFARLAVQGYITDDAAQAASCAYRYHDYLQRNVVQLSVTDRCNFRCRHCMATDGSYAGRGELTLPELESLFSQMRELGIPYIEFTGGEPLVREDFARIVDMADAAGLRIRRIYTNGFLLGRKLLDQLRALGQRPDFFISFDGLGVHDWMRGVPGAEQAALAAMDLVREAGFPLTASVNFNEKTAPVFEQTCRHLVFERGAGALHLMRTAPLPTWRAALGGQGGAGLAVVASPAASLASPLSAAASGTSPAAEPAAFPAPSSSAGTGPSPAVESGVSPSVDPFDCSAYYEAMLSLLQTARDEDWPAMLDILHMPSLHHGPLPPGTLERIADPPAVTGREKTMACCSKACSIVFVASDGRVLLCSACEGASLAWGVMGGDDVNIRSAALRDILSSSSYAARYEETVADMLEKEERCRGCRWLSLCRGGCPLARLAGAYQPTLSQSCQLFKDGYFERYLEAIGVEADGCRAGVPRGVGRDRVKEMA